MNTVIICPDIGNSSTKTIGCLWNGSGVTQRVQLQLDTLGVIMDQDDLPLSRENTLLCPQEFRGVYGHKARDAGARMLQEASIYDSPLFYQTIWAHTAEVLSSMDLNTNTVSLVLVLGFPATHLVFGEDVKRNLTGKTVTVQKDGGPPYIVTVSDVIVESQPLFGIIDQVLTWKGNRIDTSRGQELFANGTIFGISWGAYSVDFIHTPANLRAAKTTSSTRGTFSMMNQLKEMVVRQTRKVLPEYEVMFKVFRDQRIRWEGTDYDFSDQIHDIQQGMLPKIVNDARIFLKETDDQVRPYACYLMGGGCVTTEQMFKEAFDCQFPGGVSLVKDDDGKPESVWSVARGMLKRAVVYQTKKEQRI